MRQPVVRRVRLPFVHPRDMTPREMLAADAAAESDDTDFPADLTLEQRQKNLDALESVHGGECSLAMLAKALGEPRSTTYARFTALNVQLNGALLTPIGSGQYRIKIRDVRALCHYSQIRVEDVPSRVEELERENADLKARVEETERLIRSLMRAPPPGGSPPPIGTPAERPSASRVRAMRPSKGDAKCEQLDDDVEERKAG